MNDVKIKNGVILGVVLVALSLILYLVSTKAFLGWGSMVAYPIIIYFMYKTAVSVRTLNGGSISFGEATVAAIIPMAIGLLISSLFTWVLYNFIDTGLEEATKQMAIESVEKLGSFLGEDAMEGALEELENEDYSMSLGKTFMGYFFTVVIGSIIALIVGAITKRDTSA